MSGAPRHRPRWLALAWLLALVSLATVGRAEEPTEREMHRAHAIASETMSPFCPGSTVAACTSPRAAQWRAEILTWVQQGKSEAEIRNELARRAPGHDLSGAPGSAWTWGVPIFVVLVGGAVLGWVLRSFVRRPSAPASAPGSTPESELDERLEQELERLDE